MSKLALIQPSDSEQKKLGRQIEDLYVATTRGLVDCVAMGDCVAQARKIVSTCGKDRLRGGGRDKKGEGIKGWLADFAPTVPLPTAYRFEDLAEIVRDELKIGVRVNLSEVLTGEKPDAKALKLREKVTAFVAGKSQRQILLSIGKYDAKIGGARVSTKKLTPAEEQAEWIEAAKARALTALNEMHTLEERWKLLEDAKIEEAIKDAEQFTKQARKWLEVPAPQRVALDVAKYLGETTGAVEERET